MNFTLNEIPTNFLRLSLTKENVHVIGGFVARVLHFLQSPVAARPGDAKRHFALADAGRAAVDVADASDDFPSNENSLAPIDVMKPSTVR